LLSRIGGANATFLNFYVSHDSAATFLRDGGKCYVYFVNNLLLFPTIKNFQNRLLTVDEVIVKIRHHVIFETQCRNSFRTGHCPLR